MTVRDYLGLFYIYCFIGWVWESCYESVLNRKLLNRGFLTGPYIPIYGFGGIFIYILLGNLSLRFNTHIWLKIFLVSMIGATLMEYLTSYVLEKIFNARWWDYSNYPLNIKGRVCLIASLFWGLVGVVAVRYLNPFLVHKITKLNRDTLLIIVTIIATVFVMDIIVTINAIINLKNKLTYLMTETKGKVTEKVDIFSENTRHFLFSNPFVLRIIHSFPDLKFTSIKLQESYLKVYNKLKRKK